jgi:hypothetical protein
MTREKEIKFAKEEEKIKLLKEIGLDEEGQEVLIIGENTSFGDDLYEKDVNNDLRILWIKALNNNENLEDWKVVKKWAHFNKLYIFARV